MDSSWSYPDWDNNPCSQNDNLSALETGECQTAEISKTKRSQARAFEYIELFYTPKRKHTGNGMLLPVDNENTHRKFIMAGAQETGDTSLWTSKKFCQANI